MPSEPLKRATILRQPSGETGGGERQPFLGSGVETVRLTPSWEQPRTVSPASRPTKDVSAFETEETPPHDRYRLVFLTLVLHGVGTLMPWNMFITAYEYFLDHKLIDAAGQRTDYANHFLPYVGYASHVPCVLFNWANIFVQMGGDMTARIVGSLVVMVLVFVFTVVLAMLDSSQWVGGFFWATMVSIVILNTANGIFQNAVYGMAAKLPQGYTGGVVLGSNISGVMTALINLMSILLAPDLRTSAIYYFIAAIFVLLVCFDTYFALPINRFYRYHSAVHQKAQHLSKGGLKRVPYWTIFKKALPQLVNVFLVFFVTLAVFPTVLADTCRTDENFFIPAKIFQNITCFLTFNLTAMLGNMLPGLCMMPRPRLLILPILLRFLLIPAFLFCHYYPVAAPRTLPVLIPSEWVFWALVAVLGFSSGYYSSLAMMYCPRTVEPEHASIAGMMGAASIVTGVFAGVNFQLVCSWLASNVSFELAGFEDTFRNCTKEIVDRVTEEL